MIAAVAQDLRQQRPTIFLKEPLRSQHLAYYRKHGWIDLGPRPGHPEVHLMETTIPSAI